MLTGKMEDARSFAIWNRNRNARSGNILVPAFIQFNAGVRLAATSNGLHGAACHGFRAYRVVESRFKGLVPLEYQLGVVDTTTGIMARCSI